MDGGIQYRKSLVHRCEEKANREGKKLKQLESTIKEEGLFCVDVVSVSTINCEGFIIKIICTVWLA